MDGNDSSCDHLGKPAIPEPSIPEPVGLSHAPTEIILNILKYLDRKKDWLALGMTCRNVSAIIVAELDKYNCLEGWGYALCHAIVNKNYPELRRQITGDPAAVNRHFPSRWWAGKYQCALLRSKNDCVSPLGIAIDRGRSNIVRLLLSHGADPNLPTLRIPEQTPYLYPINVAAESRLDDSVAIIKMLNEFSADMCQLPGNKDTKIGGSSWFICASACPPIFRVLELDRPTGFEHIRSRPSSCETYNHDFEKIQDLRLRQLRALLECGVNPNSRFDRGLMTPIFYLLASLTSYKAAFYFSPTEMLKQDAEAQAELVNGMAIKFLDALREFGADVRAWGSSVLDVETDQSDPPLLERPLHVVCAAKEAHRLPLINWFLRNGADINDLDKVGNTPLIVYCRSRIQCIANFVSFLDRPHSINHQNSEGQSALHALCANDMLTPQVKEGAVKMMIMSGANPTLRDLNNRTPAQELLEVIKRMQPHKDYSEEKMRTMTPFKDVLEIVENEERKWAKRKSKGGRRLGLEDKCAGTHRSKSADQRHSGHRGDYRGNYRGNVASREETSKTSPAAGPSAMEPASHGKTQEEEGKKRKSPKSHNQDTKYNKNQIKDKSPVEKMEAGQGDGKQIIKPSVLTEIQERHGDRKRNTRHNQGAQCNVGQGRNRSYSGKTNTYTNPKPSGSWGAGRNGNGNENGSGSGSRRTWHERNEQTDQPKKSPEDGQKPYRGRGRPRVRGGFSQADTQRDENPEIRPKEKGSSQSTVPQNERRPIIERLLRSNQSSRK